MLNDEGYGSSFMSPIEVFEHYLLNIYITYMITPKWLSDNSWKNLCIEVNYAIFWLHFTSVLYAT